MAITIKEVERIADLANLTFTDEELELFTSQFQEILDYMAQLEAISTEETEPTYHAVAQEQEKTPMRSDRVGASFPAEESLLNAPDPAEDHFRVPRVIE